MLRVQNLQRSFSVNQIVAIYGIQSIAKFNPLSLKKQTTNLKWPTIPKLSANKHRRKTQIVLMEIKGFLYIKEYCFVFVLFCFVFSVCRENAGNRFSSHGVNIFIVFTKKKNDLQPPKSTYNHLQPPRKIQQPPEYKI